MPDYACIDVRLRSPFDLPELHPAAGDDGRPLVEVSLGPLPEVLTGAPPPFAGLQAIDDMAQFTVPGVARFRVQGGERITVDRLPGAAVRDVRLYLLGSALGLLCHQRGSLPLHANAILVGGQAFAFAGPSGAGKSTLAAHFHALGHPVLCDDVCVIRFDAERRPLAWPGLPRLKLWGDAAAAFGHDASLLEVAIEGMDKYQVPLPPVPQAEPRPLRRLYVLSRAGPGEQGMIRRLRGQAAMEAVMRNTYRGQYLRMMNLAAGHFTLCADMLDRVEVYAASRAWGYEMFEREAARLEHHVRDPEPLEVS